MNSKFNDKKLQNSVIRLLMIDNQQTTFNQVITTLDQQYSAQGKLLDDLSSFEKMLNLQWDVIIYHHAYDFTFEQALSTLNKKGKSIPIILLTDIDTKSDQALLIYKAGIYDLVSPNNLDYLALSLSRASGYSRLVRKEHQLSLEIDKLQQQTQTLVETTEYAVALFQEGVHSSVNEQYAKLFGANDVEDFIGLPLLDILQPEDTVGFKQAFKRLSKGDFRQSTFDIHSLNVKAKNRQLSLQFSAAEFESEPALQLVIMSEVSQSHPNASNAAANIDQLAQIQHLIQVQSTGSLILFIVNQFDPQLLKEKWNSVSVFSDAVTHQLSLISNSTVLQAAPHIFCSINSSHAIAELNQILAQFAAILPKSITIDQRSYAIDIAIAHTPFNPHSSDIKNLLDQAFHHRFDKDLVQVSKTVNSLVLGSVDLSSSNSISFGDPISSAGASSNLFSTEIVDHSIEEQLVQQIENNTMTLSFQQLYDKEDIDTHLYEVLASFEHNNEKISLQSFSPLNTNHELALKLDRWVLVEASKRLHQFLSQCPKTKIIVNLHAASLNDAGMLALLGKLVNLINSKYTRPLILQFKEDDLLTNMETAQRFVESVNNSGVGITICEFGQSDYSLNVLQKINPYFAKLAPSFTQQLMTDDGMVELQEKIDEFREHNNDVKFLIPELNDMTLFANAWNVDARYLQGAYFQGLQTDLVDSAS